MVRKKEFWEKRKVKTASISTLPISLSLEDELMFFISELGLGGISELYLEFLSNRLNISKKEVKILIVNFLQKEANIKKGKNSEEFRFFLGKKILERSEKKTQKERWQKYLNDKEYI